MSIRNSQCVSPALGVQLAPRARRLESRGRSPRRPADHWATTRGRAVRVGDVSVRSDSVFAICPDAEAGADAIGGFTAVAFVRFGGPNVALTSRGRLPVLSSVISPSSICSPAATVSLGSRQRPAKRPIEPPAGRSRRNRPWVSLMTGGKASSKPSPKSHRISIPERGFPSALTMRPVTMAGGSRTSEAPGLPGLRRELHQFCQTRAAMAEPDDAVFARITCIESRRIAFDKRLAAVFAPNGARQTSVRLSEPRPAACRRHQ